MFGDDPMTTPIVVRIEPPEGLGQPSRVWQAVVRRRYLILGFVIVCAALGVTLGFVVEPTYKATAVVSVRQGGSMSSSLQSLGSKLGGLGALAGLMLPADEAGSSARSMLESKLVASRIIDEAKLMPLLFPRRWDAKAGKWKDDGSKVPTIADGVKRFQRKVLSVDYDKASALISVSIVWQDRLQAAELVNAVVREVNETLRAQALRDSELSIQYLEKELLKTEALGLRSSIYSVMEQQMENGMLAKVREDFALRIIDPAMVPDDDDIHWPKKWALAFTGAFSGLIAGLFCCFLLVLREGRQNANRERNSEEDEHPREQ